MDNKRAFLAVAISFVILLGYQYFFMPTPPAEQPGETKQSAEVKAPLSQNQPKAVAVTEKEAEKPALPPVVYDREPKKVTVDTSFYTAVFSEDGGTLTSFLLKKHSQTSDKNSPGMQFIATSAEQGYPLAFSWGSVTSPRILYTASASSIKLAEGDKPATLTLTADAGNGVTVQRTYTFRDDTYLIDLDIKVTNGSGAPLQGAPMLDQVDSSLGGGVSSSADRFLFTGPSAYINDELHEVKPDEFEQAPVTLNGNIDWAGYESSYFLCALVPEDGDGQSYTMQGSEDLVRTQLAGAVITLQSGASQNWQYKLYYGPKKVSLLRDIGYNLEKSMNYGWFTIIAKPMLWLLNFFYSVVHNYGVAIILVTVLIKALFWPITYKGLKSMKNMQKLQPKMAKLKEKYKDDPQAMNREVMNLYKTYKVNPLGGCLPMVIQIPFFFALYRVLLASIELRHAPFMLWITDLAAPDRLYLGFDLPWLGGLPVLTLLMGASMWLQQKMTPTTADPMQAKVMMALPIVFTFMFLNFPSGLVLYWLINNLLSILQQVVINRESKSHVLEKKA